MSKPHPQKRKKKQAEGSSWRPVAIGGGILVVAAVALAVVFQSRRAASKHETPPSSSAGGAHASTPSPSSSTVAAPATSSGDAAKPAMPAGDSAKELAEAVAEADRLDPGWRTQELEAKRHRPPPGRDSVEAMMDVEKYRELNKHHSALGEALRNLADLPSNVVLNPSQIQQLIADLRPLQPVLGYAQRVIQLPEGYHVLKYAPDGISTLLPTVQAARPVASLLQAEALLQAQNKNSYNSSVASVRGMFNAAHSFADVPGLIPQLVHAVIDNNAMTTLQRVLAQGQPSGSELEALQRQVEAEASLPLILVAIRGERALGDDFMTAGASGRVDSQLLKQMAEIDPSRGYGLPDSSATAFQVAHSWLLRLNTRLVEIGKLPLDKQADQLKQWTAALAGAPPLAKFMVSGDDKPLQTFLTTSTRLRCAVVALAAERYRLLKGNWPESLSALVDAKLIAVVPVDPFAGVPLRLNRLGDGLVIYSVGPDGQDNNGELDLKTLNREGSDIGFRLWDVAQRHQASR